MPVPIELKGLSKHFAAVRAVDAIDLHVDEGLFYVLLGPSGCGKSTTLRLIAGLEVPTGGEVWIGRQNVTQVAPYNRDLGLVFQNYALFPHMNVAANVAFGLRMRGLSKAEVDERVRGALDLVHLGGLGDRRPSQLSGGQQQRVALARALVIEPRALLLDEPLSNLDKNLRDEMRGQIHDLQRRLGITTVMVTHDQEEALAIADRIVVMHEGRIEQTGSGQEVYRRPATHFVASFLGTANVFAGEITGDGHLLTRDGLRLPVAAAQANGPATLIIRPADAQMELVELEGGANSAAIIGTVEGSVYQGSLRRHVLRLPSGQPFYVDTQDHGEHPPEPGRRARVTYDPARCHVLPGEADDG